jgi:glycolate oxidase subunit GlcD
MTTLAESALRDVLGDGALLVGGAVRPYLRDATETRGLVGSADAVARPSSVDEVAAVVRRCYEHGIALTPFGGGTGYAGGAVPAGGVVLSLERLTRVRSLAPELWRAEVEAGVRTRDVQRLALENGLWFPPDPGAAEQSQIGGNVATNAGGPHAFKYGVTGAWVTGLEVVLPPGDVVRLGGVRKDVAGYDLLRLLVGSEGTLGVVTAVQLKLVPPPERRAVVVAFCDSVGAGADCVLAAMSSGAQPSALELLDGRAIDITRGALPVEAPAGAALAVLAEVDGSADQVAAGVEDLDEAMAACASSTHRATAPSEVAELWRWREGVGLAADAALGGKVSEDVGVPVERLAAAIELTHEIARRHGLDACAWGHAGDGNLHSTFLFDREDARARARALAAAYELFAGVVALGGTISGEHGLGQVKNGHLRDQWPAAAVALHAGVKELFDPRGLLNPGKKLA